MRQYWDPQHGLALQLAKDARPPQPTPDCCVRSGILCDLPAVYPKAAVWSGSEDRQRTSAIASDAPHALDRVAGIQSSSEYNTKESKANYPIRDTRRVARAVRHLHRSRSTCAWGAGRPRGHGQTRLRRTNRHETRNGSGAGGSVRAETSPRGPDADGGDCRSRVVGPGARYRGSSRRSTGGPWTRDLPGRPLRPARVRSGSRIQEDQRGRRPGADGIHHPGSSRPARRDPSDHPNRTPRWNQRFDAGPGRDSHRENTFAVSTGGRSALPIEPAFRSG